MLNIVQLLSVSIYVTHKNIIIVVINCLYVIVLYSQILSTYHYRCHLLPLSITTIIIVRMFFLVPKDVLYYDYDILWFPEIGVPPKSSIVIGSSLTNHPVIGYPGISIYGKPILFNYYHCPFWWEYPFLTSPWPSLSWAPWRHKRQGQPDRTWN